MGAEAADIMEMKKDFSDDEMSLAGDYHDNTSTEQLREMIESRAELDRLNAWRGTTMNQETLDRILQEAIRMRETA